MTDDLIGTLGGPLPWRVRIRAKLRILFAREPWFYHGEEDGRTVVYGVFVGDGHLRYMDSISHTAKHSFQHGMEFDERRREIMARLRDRNAEASGS
jgi:hypothetical protein